jgi:hypothetical protein
MWAPSEMAAFIRVWNYVESKVRRNGCTITVFGPKPVIPNCFPLQKYYVDNSRQFNVMALQLGCIFEVKAQCPCIFPLFVSWALLFSLQHQ